MIESVFNANNKYTKDEESYFKRFLKVKYRQLNNTQRLANIILYPDKIAKYKLEIITKYREDIKTKN